MSLVFPGVEDTLASFGLSVSRLMSEDLPTLERPMNANSGFPLLGHCARRVLLQRKRAEAMCMAAFWAKIRFWNDMRKREGSKFLGFAIYGGCGKNLYKIVIFVN